MSHYKYLTSDQKIFESSDGNVDILKTENGDILYMLIASNYGGSFYNKDEWFALLTVEQKEEFIWAMDCIK